MSQALKMPPDAADQSNTAAIVLDKVNKWYGTMHVLRDVSLTVGQKGSAWWSAGRPAPANRP